MARHDRSKQWKTAAYFADLSPIISRQSNTCSLTIIRMDRIIFVNFLLAVVRRCANLTLSQNFPCVSKSMSASIKDRLVSLEFCRWKDGDSIASLRNPDGFEAVAYIEKLEEMLSEQANEIAALDITIEKLRMLAATSSSGASPTGRCRCQSSGPNDPQLPSHSLL